MKKKILTFGNSLSHLLKDLTDKYDFILYPIDETSSISSAKKILRNIHSMRVKIDGVVSFSDDSAVLASLLGEKLHLFHTSPLSIYNSQNKAKFAEIVRIIDPSHPKNIVLTDLSSMNYSSPPFPFPVYIKPIRGTASLLSFKASSFEEYKKILSFLSNTKHRDIEWYCEFYEKYDKKSAYPLYSFIVQPYIDDRQYTLDGFVYKGKVFPLGITETIYDQNRESFTRFDFPGILDPKSHLELMIISEKLIPALGLNNTGFNLEFFVDKTNKITLIELNTRIAAQFSSLIHQHYQISPGEMMLEIACGKMPNISKKMKYKYATSFVPRVNKDHVIIKLPSTEEMQNLSKKYDIVSYEILGEVGKKLSEFRQDAYTFRYAKINILGNSPDEINLKIAKIKVDLPIILKEV